jgi:hypothetical protein
VCGFVQVFSFCRAGFGVWVSGLLVWVGVRDHGISFYLPQSLMSKAYHVRPSTDPKALSPIPLTAQPHLPKP